MRQPAGFDKLWRSSEEAFYGLGAPSSKYLAELRGLKGLNGHWQEAVLVGFDEKASNSKQ